MGSQNDKHSPAAAVCWTQVSPSPHSGWPATLLHEEPFAPLPLVMHAKVPDWSFAAHVVPVAHENGSAAQPEDVVEVEEEEQATTAPAAIDTTKSGTKKRMRSLVRSRVARAGVAAARVRAGVGRRGRRADVEDRLFRRVLDRGGTAGLSALASV